LKRQAKAHGDFYVPEEAKLAFVIRIRGINGVAPKTRKILQLLRLRQIHNGVFIKLNKATINMLRMVEPYIAYGYVFIYFLKKYKNVKRNKMKEKKNNELIIQKKIFSLVIQILRVLKN